MFAKFLILRDQFNARYAVATLTTINDNAAYNRGNYTYVGSLENIWHLTIICRYINIRYLIVGHTDGDLCARHELPVYLLCGHRRGHRPVHRVPTGLPRSQAHQHIRVPREAF